MAGKKSEKTAVNGKKQTKISSVLATQEDGTVQLTITVPYALVKEKREEALSHLIQGLEVPGFRKGKVPRDVALKHIEQQQLSNHLLQHLLPEAYTQAIEEHKLQPVLSPRFELVKIDEGEDWVVRGITCELPEVNLGDYKKEILGMARAQDIWVPGKTQQAGQAPVPSGTGQAGKGNGKQKQLTREEKEQRVIQKLLQIVNIKIPKILIDRQLEERLAQLLDQLQKLGVSIDQYLSSTGKTLDSLKEEYRRQAEETLKLEFALNKIAQLEKIKVEEAELASIIHAAGSEEAKKQLSSPQQKAVIRSILYRRRALDRLVAMV